MFPAPHIQDECPDPSVFASGRTLPDTQTWTLLISYALLSPIKLIIKISYRILLHELWHKPNFYFEP